MTYGTSGPAGPPNGGALAVETLVSAGVDAVFGLHGAHVEAVFQACLDRGVRLVDTRHEAAAGHAAEGYARTARRLGVAVVTAGPGFANAILSIANAAVDRTPVLYLAGAAPLDDAESNALQSGIDQLAVAAPLAKWAHRITHTADVPRLVAQAVRVATTAPTGPVYIEIPMDVMNGVTDVEPWPAQVLNAASAPGADVLDAILARLLGAERPLILAGAPLYRGGAEAALRELAERTGIPVFADFEALGTLPSSHSLFGGTFWQLPRLAAVDQPDVVLALGVRFGWDAPGFRGAVTAQVIHVEHEPVEIGRIAAAALGVVADPAVTTGALADRVKDRPVPDRTVWADEVRTAMRGVRTAVLNAKADAGMHPAEAAQVICRMVGADALLVADGAVTKHWLDDVVLPDRPGGYLTHGRLGAMGIGLGLAVGAQVADPHRRVVLVTGDGSVGFNIAEFDTMVRHSLPITVIVMNNRGWGASRLLQRAQRGPERTFGTDLGEARYHDVMEAFGGLGERVTTIGELEPALTRALSSGRPSCVEIVFDGDHGFPPAMVDAMMH